MWALLYIQPTGPYFSSGNFPPASLPKLWPPLRLAILRHSSYSKLSRKFFFFISAFFTSALNRKTCTIDYSSPKIRFHQWPSLCFTFFWSIQQSKIVHRFVSPWKLHFRKPFFWLEIRLSFAQPWSSNSKTKHRLCMGPTFLWPVELLNTSIFHAIFFFSVNQFIKCSGALAFFKSRRDVRFINKSFPIANDAFTQRFIVSIHFPNFFS